MADDPILFRARAAMELAAAEATSLENVRDRCERAAKAWTKMADQAERTQEQRRQRDAATAEKSAAAAEAPVIERPVIEDPVIEAVPAA